ncbi:MAG: hypothetical protein O6918_13570, partial [Deltaproteobacteria bacterium]|nr:hypothetical protein [Deltaproteobacteria bacterium]
MWPIAKRLLLGACLVALTSSILLLSDLDRRMSRSAKTSSGKWNIHLLKYSESEDSLQLEDGILQALREEASGDYELTRTSAHG